MATPSSPSGPSWPDGVELAMDVWTVQAGWDTRSDDLPRCAERLRETLTGLAGLGTPALERWLHAGNPVPGELPGLVEMLDEGRNEEDPFGELGYTVDLRNGLTDRRTVATLMVHCGTNAEYLNDSVQLQLPRQAGVPELYRADAMIALVEVIVAAWQPRWCRVRSRTLRRATHREDQLEVLASWIAYLDPTVYTRSDLPDEVRVRDSDAGPGEVFVLAPTPAELTLATIGRLRESVTFAPEWSHLS